MISIKPLDFVVPKSNPERVGIITEISKKQDGTYSASICWVGGENGLHSAWWHENQIEVVDNLARLLTKELAHPFGNGKESAEGIY